MKTTKMLSGMCAVVLLGLAGCSGGESATGTTTAAAPTPTITETSATPTADQGDVALCRTHDDIAESSRLHVRDGMPLDQLHGYVKDWMDDIGTTARAAAHARLKADAAAVTYELSVLNAELQIASTSEGDESVDVNERMTAVRQASNKMASTCRLEVDAAFTSAIFDSFA